MSKRLFYRNARDAILALSKSRKHIDEDAVGAAVGVATVTPCDWGMPQPF